MQALSRPTEVADTSVNEKQNLLSKFCIQNNNKKAYGSNRKGCMSSFESQLSLVCLVLVMQYSLPPTKLLFLPPRHQGFLIQFNKAAMLSSMSKEHPADPYTILLVPHHQAMFQCFTNRY